MSSVSNNNCVFNHKRIDPELVSYNSIKSKVNPIFKSLDDDNDFYPRNFPDVQVILCPTPIRSYSATILNDISRSSSVNRILDSQFVEMDNEDHSSENLNSPSFKISLQNEEEKQQCVPSSSLKRRNDKITNSEDLMEDDYYVINENIFDNKRMCLGLD